MLTSEFTCGILVLRTVCSGLGWLSVAVPCDGLVCYPYVVSKVFWFYFAKRKLTVFLVCINRIKME